MSEDVMIVGRINEEDGQLLIWASADLGKVLCFDSLESYLECSISNPANLPLSKISAECLSPFFIQWPLREMSNFIQYHGVPLITDEDIPTEYEFRFVTLDIQGPEELTQVRFDWVIIHDDFKSYLLDNKMLEPVILMNPYLVEENL